MDSFILFAFIISISPRGLMQWYHHEFELEVYSVRIRAEDSFIFCLSAAKYFQSIYGQQTGTSHSLFDENSVDPQPVSLSNACKCTEGWRYNKYGDLVKSNHTRTTMNSFKHSDFYTDITRLTPLQVKQF